MHLCQMCMQLISEGRQSGKVLHTTFGHTHLRICNILVSFCSYVKSLVMYDVVYLFFFRRYQVTTFVTYSGTTGRCNYSWFTLLIDGSSVTFVSGITSRDMIL
jgi:hypothetical protein